VGSELLSVETGAARFLIKPGGPRLLFQIVRPPPFGPAVPFWRKPEKGKSRSGLFPVAMTSLRWQSLYYYCLNALIRKLKLSKELVIVIGLSALRTSEGFGEQGISVTSQHAESA
jgi:hypothetical protein